MEQAHLVGVYAADAGFKGELSYILGKLSGQKSYGLCDITHGYTSLCLVHTLPDCLRYIQRFSYHPRR